MAISRREFLMVSGSLIVVDSASLDLTSVRASTTSPSLQQFLDSAGESAVIRGTWAVTSTVTLPTGLKRLELADDARIEVQGNQPALTRRGRVQVLGTIPAIEAGATRITPSFGGIAVGDVLLISGNDTISGSPDKYGYLRRVTGVSSNGVDLDRPIPRPITMNPRCGRVSLAPPISIFGKGKILNSHPSQSTAPLVDLFAVDSVEVSEIEVFNNGGPGITVGHCWGGVVAASVHDLLDDGQTYFGYGVDVAGATRDLRVAGSACRVRHAVTTSPGPATDGFGNAGEPENCVFAPTAWDCTDKAIDTHRSGWGITIIPNVTGGRGGVQVRADNTRVIGGTITGSNGPGVAVAAEVAVPPVIEGVAISNLWPSGNAVVALSAVTMRDVSIRDCAWTNVILTSRSIVTGGSISAGHPTGFEFRGSNNSVTGVALGASVTTPYVEAPGVGGNVFVASGDTPPLLPAATCVLLPAITGTIAVKSEVTATTGTWLPDRVKYTWTWLRDGVPIATATDRTYPRYVVSSEDIGAQLSVVVTARRTGYNDGRATSAPSDPIANAGGITVTQQPVVTGTTQVGKFLYVSKGVWEPYPSSVSFQWLVGGVAVSGATSASFQIRAADAGKTITARVTAVKSGYSDGVVETSGVTIAPVPLTPTTPPVVTGTGRVGSFLYASKGQWIPYPDSVSFQWTANNEPIPNATSGSYQVRSNDAGKTVTATVVARRAGYASTLYTPPGVKI